MTEPICYLCGNPEDFPANRGSELRPYGPKGEWVCFGCAFANQERTKETERQFESQLESAKNEGIPVIGLSVGPVPLKSIRSLLEVSRD